MKRRTFLQLSGLTGLSVAAPFATHRLASAAPEPYGGPYYVLINASGGWDPVFFCDPKLNPELNRMYGNIGQAGNIPFAPLPVTAATTGLDAGALPYVMSPQAFFEKYFNRLLVVNGIDMETNNHDGGTRAIWSGKLQEGFPSFGALVAAARGGDHPLAYISSGGYDVTEGLVSITRLDNVSTLDKIAYPNIVNRDEPDSGTYHTPATYDRITAAQQARLGAMREGQNLLRTQKAMDELFLARSGDNALQSLALPTDPVELPGYQLGGLQNMMRQSQLVLAAFDAGLAVAANLNLGGFDTHANHDRDQTLGIAQILAGVDFLLTQAEAMGLADKLTIMVGSDFARGPGYNGANDNAGKDHWSIGSAMFMGAGISGNQVVGATDDTQRALEYQGTNLKVTHIHHAMRQLAGIDGHDYAKEFALPGEAVNIF